MMKILIAVAIALGCVAGTIYKNMVNESVVMSVGEKQSTTMEYRPTQEVGCGNVGGEIHCAL